MTLILTMLLAFAHAGDPKPAHYNWIGRPQSSNIEVVGPKTYNRLTYDQMKTKLHLMVQYFTDLQTGYAVAETLSCNRTFSVDQYHTMVSAIHTANFDNVIDMMYGKLPFPVVITPKGVPSCEKLIAGKVIIDQRMKDFRDMQDGLNRLLGLSLNLRQNNCLSRGGTNYAEVWNVIAGDADQIRKAMDEKKFDDDFQYNAVNEAIRLNCLAPVPNDPPPTEAPQ